MMSYFGVVSLAAAVAAILAAQGRSPSRGIVVHTETTITDRTSKKPRRLTTEIFAVRADGASVHITEYERFKGVRHRMLEFPEQDARVLVTEGPGGQTAVQRNGRGLDIAEQRAKLVAADCVPKSPYQNKDRLPKLVGTEKVHGLRALKLQLPDSEPGTVAYGWRAPELYCAEVQLLISDGKSESFRRVTKVEFRAPDPKLFEIPPPKPNAAGTTPAAFLRPTPEQLGQSASVGR